MRILFEITHPKHAHLFKNCMETLKRRGHRIAIAARDKDVTVRLLDAWGLERTVLSKQPDGGLLRLGKELAVRDWRMWRLARRFRPDVFVASVGPSASHLGWLLRKPTIMFEDTEHATLQQAVTFPFSTHVCTAVHYEKNWGRKHLRYASFDELAYLHPNRFRPDASVPRAHGLEPGGYIVVRFVAWRAAHDIGQSGIRSGWRLKLLERLGRHARVIATSEAPLPEAFERFRVPLPPEQFHHVLAFAKLAFVEGSTVATEGAVLGVPGIVVNTMNLGSVNRLANHYRLLFKTESDEEGLRIAERLLQDPDTPARWRERREALLRNEGDLSEWMVERIEALGMGRTLSAGPS